MIRRNKEIDVAVGDTRIVILVHEKDGEKVLWPVLRQQPPVNDNEGILGGWTGCVCLYVHLCKAWKTAAFVF